MRVALVENNVIVNIIIADNAEDWGGVEVSDEVGIGWVYDGESFNEPQPDVVEPENGSYRIYKSMFIQRLEPSEAAILEGVLQEEDPKLRLMFNAVEYFASDDPLTAYMHWIVAVALGSEDEPNFDRADELLAR